MALKHEKPTQCAAPGRGEKLTDRLERATEQFSIQPGRLIGRLRPEFLVQLFGELPIVLEGKPDLA